MGKEFLWQLLKSYGNKSERPSKLYKTQESTQVSAENLINITSSQVETKRWNNREPSGQKHIFEHIASLIFLFLIKVLCWQRSRCMWQHLLSYMMQYYYEFLYIIHICLYIIMGSAITYFRWNITTKQPKVEIIVG